MQPCQNVPSALSCFRPQRVKTVNEDGDRRRDTVNLNELRLAVDDVDDDLLLLLKKRQSLASRIGELKRGMGLPVYDPLREREILARLSRNNAGQLREEAVLSAWREPKHLAL